MLATLKTIWQLKDLRRRILLTVGLVAEFEFYLPDSVEYELGI